MSPNCTCIECGKQFHLRPSEIARGRGKYCSKACANAAKVRSVACVCEHCGKQFTAPLSHFLRGRAHHCSIACRSAAQIQPIEARFWANVEKSRGCWVWRGSLDNGYGVLHTQHNRQRTRIAAHRFSYELHNGPIPKGLSVCHRCDNPPCVNPAHLFLGTNADNVRDKVEKMRHAHGESIGAGKLTDQQVLEIRRRFVHGESTRRELQAEFGVSYPSIWMIVAGQSWKHLLNPSDD